MNIRKEIFGYWILNKMSKRLLTKQGEGKMKKTMVWLALTALSAAVFAAEPIVWNKENSFKGWGSQFRCKKTISKDGMVITVTGADCNISNNNVKINPKENSQLLIEYRSKDIPAKNNGKLYYATASKGFNEVNVWNFRNLKNDGNWHTLKLINDSKRWLNAGTITKLRLDIIEQSSGTVEIRSITLSTPEEE